MQALRHARRFCAHRRRRNVAHERLLLVAREARHHLRAKLWRQPLHQRRARLWWHAGQHLCTLRRSEVLENGGGIFASSGASEISQTIVAERCYRRSRLFRGQAHHSRHDTLSVARCIEHLGQLLRGFVCEVLGRSLRWHGTNQGASLFDAHLRQPSLHGSLSLRWVGASAGRQHLAKLGGRHLLSDCVCNLLREAGEHRAHVFWRHGFGRVLEHLRRQLRDEPLD
mmetsp:Transcript_6928/g.22996  ORF Transcript_6928/g.22996 Transcript_6928/m.22996 type:complete len:226 (+) Transcript_6928:4032-4709(+)